MTAPPRDDSVLPVTRLAHGILAIVVAPFFYGLTFHPGNTVENFAWPLVPTMSAMFFGSLYFAVIYSFLRVAFAKRWHEVALVLWATLPVLAMLGIVTIRHWEKFAHGTLRFSIWITAYVVFPTILLLMILANRRRDPRTPNPGDVEIPATVRRTSLLLGIVVGLVGVALILFPKPMAAAWPWPIKELSSQALGCLFLAPAVAQFIAAKETRWSALRISTQAAILWFSLLLVAVVRAFDEFDRSRPLTWVFLVFLAMEWLLATWSYVALEGQRRRNEAALGRAS
ncbi:MAG: hypothetical protein NTY35_03725 [Planctomycetota bacterium]|nr:hypothetical protein [Planctomycetota bacterium]